MSNSVSLNPAQPGMILMVDDEVELVHAVGAMLRATFGESRVRVTNESEKALAWITREKPAVLITDIRMPHHSGLELIAHTQKVWGPTATIVITAFPSEEVMASAQRGSFVYLPKPFTFQSLVETIQRLEAVPPAAFSGAIAVSTLADLLQLYALSGATGVMVIRNAAQRGEVWFERGQVTHAQADHTEGVEAFNAILAWPTGSFSWRPRRSDRHTISKSLSELLLEAYQQQDEASRDTEHDPAVSLAPDFLLEDTTPSAPEITPPPAAPREAPPDDLDDADDAAIRATLVAAGHIPGMLGAAIVDSEGRVIRGAIGEGIDIATATMANIELVRAKRNTLRALNLDDEIEDILITLGEQYHLLRLVRSRPGWFLYAALSRPQANLATARLQLADAERKLATRPRRDRHGDV